MAHEVGEIVWVKLGSLWWPGEVYPQEELPDGLLESMRKEPIAFVKFFQENTFEYVRNRADIFKYQCARKVEFIKKGLALFKQGNKCVEKFPTDVMIAESRTSGDPNIIFTQEFGIKPGHAGLNPMTPLPNPDVTPPTVQEAGTLSTKPHVIYILGQQSPVPTAAVGDTPKFKCHQCTFVTNRINLMTMHSKSHLPSKPPTPVPPVRNVRLKEAEIKKQIDAMMRSCRKRVATPGPGVHRARLSDFQKPSTSTSGTHIQTHTSKEPRFNIPKTSTSKKDELKVRIDTILADWIDDDDEEESPPPPVTRIFRYSRVVPVAAPASAPDPESSPPSSSQKETIEAPVVPKTTTPKYRNIPKKDRREIILDKFVPVESSTTIILDTDESSSEPLKSVATEYKSNPEVAPCTSASVPPIRSEEPSTSSLDADVIVTLDLSETTKPYKKRILRRSSIVRESAKSSIVVENVASGPRVEERRQPEEHIVDIPSQIIRVDTPVRRSRFRGAHKDVTAEESITSSLQEPIEHNPIQLNRNLTPHMLISVSSTDHNKCAANDTEVIERHGHEPPHKTISSPVQTVSIRSLRSRKALESREEPKHERTDIRLPDPSVAELTVSVSPLELGPTTSTDGLSFTKNADTETTAKSNMPLESDIAVTPVSNDMQMRKSSVVLNKIDLSAKTDSTSDVVEHDGNKSEGTGSIPESTTFQPHTRVSEPDFIVSIPKPTLPIPESKVKPLEPTSTKTEVISTKRRGRSQKIEAIEELSSNDAIETQTIRISLPTNELISESKLEGALEPSSRKFRSQNPGNTLEEVDTSNLHTEDPTELLTASKKTTRLQKGKPDENARTQRIPIQLIDESLVTVRRSRAQNVDRSPDATDYDDTTENFGQKQANNLNVDIPTAILGTSLEIPEVSPEDDSVKTGEQPHFFGDESLRKRRSRAKKYEPSSNAKETVVTTQNPEHGKADHLNVETKLDEYTNANTETPRTPDILTEESLVTKLRSSAKKFDLSSDAQTAATTEKIQQHKSDRLNVETKLKESTNENTESPPIPQTLIHKSLVKKRRSGRYLDAIETKDTSTEKSEPKRSDTGSSSASIGISLEIPDVSPQGIHSENTEEVVETSKQQITDSIINESLVSKLRSSAVKVNLARETPATEVTSDKSDPKRVDHLNEVKADDSTNENTEPQSISDKLFNESLVRAQAVDLSSEDTETEVAAGKLEETRPEPLIVESKLDKTTNENMETKRIPKTLIDESLITKRRSCAQKFNLSTEAPGTEDMTDNSKEKQVDHSNVKSILDEPINEVTETQPISDTFIDESAGKRRRSRSHNVDLTSPEVPEIEVTTDKSQLKITDHFKVHIPSARSVISLVIAEDRPQDKSINTGENIETSTILPNQSVAKKHKKTKEAQKPPNIQSKLRVRNGKERLVETEHTELPDVDQIQIDEQFSSVAVQSSAASQQPVENTSEDVGSCDLVSLLSAEESTPLRRSRTKKDALTIQIDNDAPSVSLSSPVGSSTSSLHRRGRSQKLSPFIMSQSASPVPTVSTFIVDTHSAELVLEIDQVVSSEADSYKKTRLRGKLDLSEKKLTRNHHHQSSKPADPKVLSQIDTTSTSQKERSLTETGTTSEQASSPKEAGRNAETEPPLDEETFKSDEKNERNKNEIEMVSSGVRCHVPINEETQRKSPQITKISDKLNYTIPCEVVLTQCPAIDVLKVPLRTETDVSLSFDGRHSDKIALADPISATEKNNILHTKKNTSTTQAIDSEVSGAPEIHIRQLYQLSTVPCEVILEKLTDEEIRKRTSPKGESIKAKPKQSGSRTSKPNRRQYEENELIVNAAGKNDMLEKGVYEQNIDALELISKGQISIEDLIPAQIIHKPNKSQLEKKPTETEEYINEANVSTLQEPTEKEDDTLNKTKFTVNKNPKRKSHKKKPQTENTTSLQHNFELKPRNTEPEPKINEAMILEPEANVEQLESEPVTGSRNNKTHKVPKRRQSELSSLMDSLTKLDEDVLSGRRRTRTQRTNSTITRIWDTPKTGRKDRKPKRFKIEMKRGNETPAIDEPQMLTVLRTENSAPAKDVILAEVQIIQPKTIYMGVCEDISEKEVEPVVIYETSKEKAEIVHEVEMQEQESCSSAMVKPDMNNPTEVQERSKSIPRVIAMPSPRTDMNEDCDNKTDMDSNDSTLAQIDDADTVINDRPLGDDQSQDNCYRDSPAFPCTAILEAELSKKEDSAPLTSTYVNETEATSELDVNIVVSTDPGEVELNAMKIESNEGGSQTEILPKMPQEGERLILECSYKVSSSAPNQEDEPTETKVSSKPEGIPKMSPLPVVTVGPNDFNKIKGYDACGSSNPSIKSVSKRSRKEKIPVKRGPAAPSPQIESVESNYAENFNKVSFTLENIDPESNTLKHFDYDLNMLEHFDSESVPIVAEETCETLEEISPNFFEEFESESIPVVAEEIIISEEPVEGLDVFFQVPFVQESVELTTTMSETYPILNDANYTNSSTSLVRNDSSNHSASNDSTPKTSPNQFSTDPSKDMDCFDFTEEDENETPKVLKRNKRRPTPKENVIESSSTPKSPNNQEEEEEEDTPFVLKSLSILTETQTHPSLSTSYTSPDPVSGSQSDKTTPTKDEERPLHPKERNKRIFKSRNHNRSGNESAENIYDKFTIDQNIDARNTSENSDTKSIESKTDETSEPNKDSSLQAVLEQALRNDEKRLRKLKSREADQKIMMDGFDLNQKDLAITDEEIKIAEALITFPMLGDITTDTFVSETETIILPKPESRKRTFDEALLPYCIPMETNAAIGPPHNRTIDTKNKPVERSLQTSPPKPVETMVRPTEYPSGSRSVKRLTSEKSIIVHSSPQSINMPHVYPHITQTLEQQKCVQQLTMPSGQVSICSKQLKNNGSMLSARRLSVPSTSRMVYSNTKPNQMFHPTEQFSTNSKPPEKPTVRIAPPGRLSNDLVLQRCSMNRDAPSTKFEHLPPDSFITLGGAIVKRITPSHPENSHEPKIVDRHQIQILHNSTSLSVANVLASNLMVDNAHPPSDTYVLPCNTSILPVNRNSGSRMSLDQPTQRVIIQHGFDLPQNGLSTDGTNHTMAPISRSGTTNHQTQESAAKIRKRRNTTAMKYTPTPNPININQRHPVQPPTAFQQFLPHETLNTPPNPTKKRKPATPEQQSLPSGLPHNINVAAASKIVENLDNALRSIVVSNQDCLGSANTQTIQEIPQTRRRTSTHPVPAPPIERTATTSQSCTPRLLVNPPRGPINQQQQPINSSTTPAPKAILPPTVRQPQPKPKRVKKQATPKPQKSRTSVKCSQPSPLVQSFAGGSQQPMVDPIETPSPIVEDANSMDLMAVSSDQFGGPINSYFLCRLKKGIYEPIDREPLYLNSANQLVTDGEMPTAIKNAVQSIHDMENANQLQQEEQQLIEEYASEGVFSVTEHNADLVQQLQETFRGNTTFLLDTADGQQIVLDHQGILELASSGQSPEFITADGQQIVLQNTPQEILLAIGLNDDMVNTLMANQHCLIAPDEYVNHQDIIAAALADTDVYPQPDQYITEVLQPSNGLEPSLAYPLQHVATTSTKETVATKTIMSTLEQPSQKTDRLTPTFDLLRPSNLEQSLAVIGVTQSNVPTSLELPITVTNPAIAPPPSSSNPMSIYACSSTNAGVPLLGISASNPNIVSSIPSASAEVELGYNLFSTASTHTIQSTHHQSEAGSIVDDSVVPNPFISNDPIGQHYYVVDPQELEMDTVIVPVTQESVIYAARSSPFGKNDFSCDSSDSSNEIPIQPTYVQQHHELGPHGLRNFDTLGTASSSDNVRYVDMHEVVHYEQQELVESDQHQHYMQIENGDVLVDADLQFMDDADVFVDSLERGGDPADVFNVASLDEEHGSAANFVHR